MASSTLLTRTSDLSEMLGELVERVRPAIVAVRDGRRGSGTGVVWSSNTVITNHHVVRGDRAELVFSDGRPSDGHVIGRDPHNDVVALHVEDAPAPASIGDSRALRIGQIALAVGHPLGVEHAVTVGIVSSLPSPSDPRAMIRSDLHLYPGNSGGPLMTADGNVVGINAMVAGPGTALTVPEETVRAFLSRLDGSTPALGIELRPVEVPPAWRAAGGFDVRSGLLVTAVESRSLAERSGIYPGDLLLAVDNRPVRHPLRLLEDFAATAHREITLHLVRAGQPIDVVVGSGSV